MAQLRRSTAVRGRICWLTTHACSYLLRPASALAPKQSASIASPQAGSRRRRIDNPELTERAILTPYTVAKSLLEQSQHDTYPIFLSHGLRVTCARLELVTTLSAGIKHWDDGPSSSTARQMFVAYLQCWGTWLFLCIRKFLIFS